MRHWGMLVFLDNGFGRFALQGRVDKVLVRSKYPTGEN